MALIGIFSFQFPKCLLNGVPPPQGRNAQKKARPVRDGGSTPGKDPEPDPSDDSSAPDSETETPAPSRDSDLQAILAKLENLQSDVNTRMREHFWTTQSKTMISRLRISSWTQTQTQMMTSIIKTSPLLAPWSAAPYRTKSEAKFWLGNLWNFQTYYPKIISVNNKRRSMSWSLSAKIKRQPIPVTKINETSNFSFGSKHVTFLHPYMLNGQPLGMPCWKP